MDADAADVTAALKTIDAAALDDVWVEKAYSESACARRRRVPREFRGAGDVPEPFSATGLGFNTSAFCGASKVPFAAR